MIFYKSQRIGKNGKPFNLYKFRTLKINIDKTSSFATTEQYTFFGKFLRKTKLDELPQILNVLKGDISIFGYRPEEQKTWEILPEQTREIISKHKPGIIDLSSLHFFEEEKLMQVGDAHQTYWQKVRPMKLTLQMFYLENNCWLLNIAIVWIFIKKVMHSLFSK